ncbi:MAG: hypothetical protein MHM6MM_004470 [Cercozoa sp. M6MM]
MKLLVSLALVAFSVIAQSVDEDLSQLRVPPAQELEILMASNKHHRDARFWGMLHGIERMDNGRSDTRQRLTALTHWAKQVHLVHSESRLGKPALFAETYTARAEVYNDERDAAREDLQVHTRSSLLRDEDGPVAWDADVENLQTVVLLTDVDVVPQVHTNELLNRFERAAVLHCASVPRAMREVCRANFVWLAGEPNMHPEQSSREVKHQALDLWQGIENTWTPFQNRSVYINSGTMMVRRSAAPLFTRCYRRTQRWMIDMYALPDDAFLPGLEAQGVKRNWLFPHYLWGDFGDDQAALQLLYLLWLVNVPKAKEVCGLDPNDDALTLFFDVDTWFQFTMVITAFDHRWTSAWINDQLGNAREFVDSEGRVDLRRIGGSDVFKGFDFDAAAEQMSFRLLQLSQRYDLGERDDRVLWQALVDVAGDTLAVPALVHWAGTRGDARSTLVYGEDGLHGHHPSLWFQRG